MMWGKQQFFPPGLLPPGCQWVHPQTAGLAGGCLPAVGHWKVRNSYAFISISLVVCISWSGHENGSGIDIWLENCFSQVPGRQAKKSYGSTFLWKLCDREKTWRYILWGFRCSIWQFDQFDHLRYKALLIKTIFQCRQNIVQHRAVWAIPPASEWF